MQKSHLKQKVIKTLTVIICVVVLAASGYLIYFIVSDTPLPPPDVETTENLFVAKQLNDIENLKATTGINECKAGYDTLLLSLKEDTINSFIDDEQLKSLDENLNLVFNDLFIALANEYFEQSDWDNNVLIKKIIAQIKSKGFADGNTQIGDILQGFEDNISCYYEMQQCINEINAVSAHLNNYIPFDEISDLKIQMQSLINRNCVKNTDAVYKLKSSYENLENNSLKYIGM